MKTKQLPLWMSAPLIVGAFGPLLWGEYRRPLRRAVEPKLRRVARNLAVAAVSAAALQLSRWQKVFSQTRGDYLKSSINMRVSAIMTFAD